MDYTTQRFRAIAFDRVGKDLINTGNGLKEYEVKDRLFKKRKVTITDNLTSQAIIHLIDEMQFVTSVWLKSFNTGEEEFAEFEKVIQKMGEILFEDLIEQNGHS
jgi:hypothetical protein